MSKKRPPPGDSKPPYFKAFPSNFISGCIVLSAEEKGVYYTLLMVLYDRMEPIEDRTAKQRQDLARFCGISTRRFGVVLEALLAMPGKLFRDAEGRLSNERFERTLTEYRTNRADLSGGKTADKSKINGPINGDVFNENNGLNASRAGARANLPEARSQNPEQSLLAAAAGGEDQGQGKIDPVILESELSQVCAALGVDLRADTKRIAWPQQLARLKGEFGLSVALDILPAIETYAGQLKGSTVRSLMYLKDRALERKQARELADRIAGITTAREGAAAAAVTPEQWEAALRQFLALGSWPTDSLGPSPLMPGCRAPDALLDRASEFWQRQGNHPEAMHHGGTRGPWQHGKAGAVREVTPFAPRSTRASAAA